MTLQEKVAVALHGAHASESEPCMEAAGKACEVFADFLVTQEAHEVLCKEIRGVLNRCCLCVWEGQRGLAKAVRGKQEWLRDKTCWASCKRRPVSSTTATV